MQPAVASSGEESSPAARPINIDTEMQKLRTAFGLLDRDRDGRVTASELQHMLSNMRIYVSSEVLTELLAQASESGASLVNESEFLKWVPNIEAVTAEAVASAAAVEQDPDVKEALSRLCLETTDEEEEAKNLMAAFRVFDRDSDGYITKDELSSAMELIGEPVTEQELDEMLAMADIDKDGRINYEEFAKLLS